MIASLKSIHWTALGLAVASAILLFGAQQPQLAPFSGLLSQLAALLGTGSLGTALAAPSVKQS
jgi:hypothetical protein